MVDERLQWIFFEKQGRLDLKSVLELARQLEAMELSFKGMAAAQTTATAEPGIRKVASF